MEYYEDENTIVIRNGFDAGTEMNSKSPIFNRYKNGPLVEYFETIFKHNLDSPSRVEMVTDNVPPSISLSSGSTPVEINNSQLELHIALEDRFPYVASQRLVSTFKKTYKSCYDLNRNQMLTLIPYLKAAIYFDACAQVLKVLDDSNIEPHQPLKEFNSGLCCNQLLSELQSLQQLRKSHKGRIYIKDGMVSVHRWLFFGLIAEGVSLSSFSQVDIGEFYSEDSRTIVFGGESSSYHFIKKLIVEEFKNLQEEQGEVFDRIRRFVRDLCKTTTSISNKPLHWRQNESLIAPTNFDVLNFDPEHPFSILGNVPLDSPYYEKMELLCKAYEFDIPDVKDCSNPYNWVQIILGSYSNFDWGSFEYILRIHIVTPIITGRFLMERFLNFKNNYNAVYSVVGDLDDLPTDVAIVPFIAKKQYCLLLSDLSNDNTLVEEVNFGKEYEYFNATY